MKTQNQQCPRCDSIEMPDSIYCSKCACNLIAPNNSAHAPKVTTLTKRQWIIFAAILFPLAFIFAIAGALENPKTQNAPTATTSAFAPVNNAAQYISSTEPSNAATIEGKVVGVSDGDTIKVLDKNNAEYKIRLEGVDAPESKQDFGNKAKENLSNLVFGKVVQVISNKTDKYGRHVGKVLLNGTDVNLEQIKSGLAWHYKEYAKEQSAADRKLYAEAETTAKDGKLGFWSMAKPIAPWDWRHGANVRPEDAKKIFGNKNSFIYHWAGCPGFTKIGEKNRVVFNSTEEAEEAGYRPAKNCSKPAPEKNADIEHLEEDVDDLEASVETETETNSAYVVPVAPTYSAPSAAPVSRSAPEPEVYAPSRPSYEPETTTTTSTSASARCADGTLSYSASRQGTCSHHGGVAEWLNGDGTATKKETPSYSPSCTPSYTPSDSGRPKTVQVRGYTRKDGTYVAPHTRSAPRRRN